jgi:S-methylmethionine-dependent homocysteine/selenocysteine methylase
MNGDVFLTDGGIETTLVFHDGLDLPYFAAFDLLKSNEGRMALRRYYQRHATIADRAGTGFIFESATWRASADWGDKLGYSRAELADANRQAVRLMEDVRVGFPRLRAVVSGCVGPRGDGYDPGELMRASEAERYHAEQIGTFRTTSAQMITAITMTNVPEAVGVTRAATAAGLPVVISFTVETDGTLPSGEYLGDAIEAVDAQTDGAPAYFMINCAHPDHFRDTLAQGGAWLRRLCGIRANASRCSHAELDEAEELDEGSPVELGRNYAELRAMLPHLVVLGGCCGTDHRHIAEIATACLEPA